MELNFYFLLDDKKNSSFMDQINGNIILKKENGEHFLIFFKQKILKLKKL